MLVNKNVNDYIRIIISESYARAEDLYNAYWTFMNIATQNKLILAREAKIVSILRKNA